MSSDVLAIKPLTSSGPNESFDHYIPGDGIKLNTGAYIALTNCDYFVAYYTG